MNHTQTSHSRKSARVFVSLRALLSIGIAALLLTRVALADMGRTPGVWAVTPAGAATYRIPLWTPAGPGGIQPAIALAYSSESQMGVVGVGWQISGLMSITRCASTITEDGIAQSVALDYSDRFCINGNKLRITSGDLTQYGLPNSEYQTQLADFSRITAQGTHGSGPESFVMHTKSGLIMEFGNTPDSKITRNGPTILTWMLNKVSDRNGNSYVVTYRNDADGFVPESIKWAPTTAGGANYQYRMFFDYTLRTNPKEISSVILAGLDVSNKYRLNTISVGYSSDGSAYATKRLYVTEYEFSPTTNFSRLTSFKECAADTSNCLLPTTMTYQNGGKGVVTTATTAVGAAAASSRGRFDFNGDGKNDLYWSQSGTIRVAFGTGLGFTSSFNTGLASGTAGRFVSSHKDGFLTAVSGTWRYTGWNGSAFVTTNTGTPVDTTSTIVTDQNGDGLADLIWTAVGSGTPSTEIKLRRNVTTGSATVPTFASTPALALRVELGQKGGNLSLINASQCPLERQCDVDGNGTADLAANLTTTFNCPASGPCTPLSSYQEVFAVGGGYALRTINGSGTGPVYLGIRFNDDRCIDKIIGGSTGLIVSPCRASGGSAATIALPAAPAAVIDWDADGNTDLLVNSGGTIGIYLSNGTVSNPFGPLLATTIPYNSNCTYFSADFDGDGLDELACASNVSPFAVTFYTHAGGGSAGTAGTGQFATQLPDVVSSISDGYGVSFSPSYVSTGQTNYTPGTGTTVPLVDDTSIRYVVGRVTVSDGIGTAYHLDYNYKGARLHGLLDWVDPATDLSQSRTVFGPDGGDAGFEQISVVDSRDSQLTRTTYEQVFPKTGMVKTTERFQSNQSTLISTSTNDNQFYSFPVSLYNQRYFDYIASTTTDENEVSADANVNGRASKRIKVTYAYSDFTYGNVSTQTTETTDLDPNSPLTGNKWTDTVTMTYESPVTSGGDWCIGLPRRVTINEASSEPGLASVDHVVQFDKDPNAPSKCRSYRKTTEPDKPKYLIVENYEFDDFGNVSKTTTVGRQPGPTTGSVEEMLPRVTNSPWSSTGQFPKEIVDAEGTKVAFTYDAAAGKLQKETDPNGLETSYEYDDFGRIKKVTRPDGTNTRTLYSSCAVQGCVYGTHKVTVSQMDVDTTNHEIANRLIYLDAFERPFATLTQSLNGYPQWDLSYTWNEVEYDAYGRVWRRWMPCVSNNLISSCHTYPTTFEFDQLGRVVKETRRKSAALADTQSTQYFFAGRTQSVQDAQGKSVTRITDVNGRLRRVTDANNYAIKFDLDATGVVTGVKDSLDNTKLSGVTVEYGIVPFVVSKTDAALGASTHVYNSLGEEISWTDARNHTFTMKYDKVSRPVQRDEPDANTRTVWTWGTGTGPAPDLYNKGRLLAVSFKENNETYSESFVYDSSGRLKSQAISIPGDSTYTYEYGYDPVTGLPDTLKYPLIMGGEQLILKYGYQHGVLQTISAPGGSPQYWMAKSSNGRGQVTEDYFGNNTKRTRVFDAVTSFMSSITSGGVGTPDSLQSQRYLYDQVGNVIQRANDKRLLTENFVYGSGTDQLYRLEHSQLSGSAANNLEMKYDLSGNITQKNSDTAIPIVSQSISWTNYNLPSQIVANSGSGQETATFAYGPGRERWRMVFARGSESEKTYYVGGLTEVISKNGGSPGYRLTIQGPEGPVAIYTRSPTDPGTFNYVLPDHQGSIETLAGANANLIANESFTAYGERRDSTDWSGPPADPDTLDKITRQGYTHQTALGSMGLNHMNGRVQDAVNGRFLSPDPFIGNPFYTQSYNRYSYVYNNPATFTDPSGFWAELRCATPSWEEVNYLPGDGELTVTIEVIHHEASDCEWVWIEDPTPDGGDYGWNDTADGGYETISIRPECPASNDTKPAYVAQAQAAQGMAMNQPLARALLGLAEARGPDQIHVTATFKHVEVGLTNTRYGQTFVTVGGSTSSSGASLQAGYLLQGNKPTPQDFVDFDSGETTTISGGDVVGGSFAFNDANKEVAAGLTTPGFGVSYATEFPSLRNVVPGIAWDSPSTKRDLGGVSCAQH